MSALTITLNPTIDKTFDVERVVAERKLTASNIKYFPGGGGINVARVVHRLGAEACALWSCGGDTGAHLSRMLDAEGVSHVPIAITDSTRENLIVHDLSCDQQYRFGMPGPDLTPHERDEWERRIRDQMPHAQYAVFSGSLSSQAQLDWFSEMLRAAAGTRLIVDTKHHALMRALEVGVYLVKPNVHELEELLHRELMDEDDIAAACRELIDRGAAEVVLVSLGQGGAMLVTGERSRRFPAPTVHERSRVGAGDSMVGGLLTGLLQGRSLTESARLGVAAGAAAVMTVGTELGRADDTWRLLPLVAEPEPVT
ncbi:MAG: 1-phosphofructokinase family hexose kinase [Pseudomonadota bacterium]